jgi:hypothetical protein
VIPKDEETETNGSGSTKRQLDGFGSATYGEISIFSVPTLISIFLL